PPWPQPCAPVGTREPYRSRPGEETLEARLHARGCPALAPHAPVAEPAGQGTAELARLAHAPREADDRLDPRPAPRDVAGERRLHALLAPVGLRELVGEHDRVFHRHARALSEIRRQRVRGVAEQRDAAACPGLLTHLLDVGAHDALGRPELGERASYARVREAAEQRLQRADALERPGPALDGRVERRPHVELPAGNRHEPDALAAAEELGEVLEPVAVGDHEAMGAVAEI